MPFFHFIMQTNSSKCVGVDMKIRKPNEKLELKKTEKSEIVKLIEIIERLDKKIDKLLKENKNTSK